MKNFYKSSYIQKPLTPEEENAYLELKLAAKQHQSQLLDKSFVSSIEKEGVKIIVRKGENISYANKGFESSTLTEALPKFEAANINSRGTTELGETFYRYVKFDFYFPEKEEGSIFVLKSKVHL